MGAPPPGLPPQAIASYMAAAAARGAPAGPPRVRLYGESGTELVPAALRTAADLGAVVTNLRLLRPSLEDGVKRNRQGYELEWILDALGRVGS